MISIMLSRPGYKLRLLVAWIIVLALFLWLPRINLLSYIFTQAPISFSEKLSYIFEDFARIASALNNPIVISTLIFSILTAVSIVLLIFMFKTSRLLNTKASKQSKTLIGVATTSIGSHLLACGGTILLAPIFPALAGTSAVLGGTGATVNLWLATSANILGIALVIFAIQRTSKDLARMVLANNTR